MKKLIFLLAVVAAAVAYFLRREDATKLWGSAKDTLSSWGEPVTSKAEELADTASKAADSATTAARDAAKKATEAAG
jgi:hypothetical protein